MWIEMSCFFSYYSQVRESNLLKRVPLALTVDLLYAFIGASRNGHKLTHATKKPHGCHFCDKSYSDARSLRRHYESAHPDLYEQWRLLSNLAEVTYQGREFSGCTPSSTTAEDESAGAGAFDGPECRFSLVSHCYLHFSPMSCA
ncbi:unnamed protein product [Schistocephalus solidus]|uniref:C2H2-type domain-containing protein n=1 Tax=Schistocephalus solidus TaxID=70667 RepID=A0A183TU92_SCHSO|nr:unnamed protein product [Schistocephalus solidus]